MTDGQMDERNN